MKIITVNRNNFVTGGPEKYWFSLRELLFDDEFIPFCVRFKQNEVSSYSKYFVEPPGGQDNVYFKDFRMSTAQKLAYAVKSVYSFEAKRKLEALIKDTNPDVAFFLNAVFFSDSIIDACKKCNIPIIWRMSDYNKVCANYFMMRDGATCEACLEHGFRKAIRYRCGGYQRSRGAAIVKVTGMWLSHLRGIYKHVNYFITPSAFMREKMIQGGFAAEKIVHIPTFISMQNCGIKPLPEKPNILYVGRLSPEKGIDVLLRAFSLIENKEVTLSIVGDHSSAYAESLIATVPPHLKMRILFHGFQEQEAVGRFFQECSLFVVPSVWYENLPNVVLEGMAHGRTAVVSRLGSLTEMVIDKVTGRHFEAGNASDLAKTIDELIESPEDLMAIGMSSREYVHEKHNPQDHISAIKNLFEKCLM